MVALAISQPEDVDIDELVFRPTAQELQEKPVQATSMAARTT
jgi:hypothetical protein